MKKKLKIIGISTLALILALVIGVGGLFFGEIRTLVSFKQLNEHPFYEMTYHADYNLDEFLVNGAATDDDLVSFGSEVNTHEIIKKAIIDKKNIYVPKIDMKKKEMIAVKIHSLIELSVNNYGILEPINVDKDKIANDFDIIVMPGVAFDENGNRIGYGGGYYDKYLEKNIFKAKKVALAYEEQILERIESDFHDIKVDFIINTKKIIKKYCE